MQENISTAETPKRRSRRSYTKEFKASIVAECRQGEKSIAQVAMEHQINANLIHKWSRQLDDSHHQPMVPVTMTAAVNTDCDRIDVLIGDITVRFVGRIDAHNARVVLDAIR